MSRSHLVSLGLTVGLTVSAASVWSHGWSHPKGHSPLGECPVRPSETKRGQMTADQIALFDDPVEQARVERQRIIHAKLAELDGRDEEGSHDRPDPG